MQSLSLKAIFLFLVFGCMAPGHGFTAPKLDKLPPRQSETATDEERNPSQLASPQSAEIATNRRQLEDAINALTLERGAYGLGLDEAYSEYGQLFLEQGDYQKATQLFRQAWHLSRVNFGLHSEEQLDHLNLLIEALVHSKQWDEVHDLHRLSFLIASQIYAAEDIRYLIAAEFYTNWQWQAIKSRRIPQDYSSVIDFAQSLSANYTAIINKLEHSHSRDTRGLVNLLFGKARTDMAIARAVADTTRRGAALRPSTAFTAATCATGNRFTHSNTQECGSQFADSRGFTRELDRHVKHVLAPHLREIEHSMLKLQRIRNSTEEMSTGERQWIDRLVFALRTEASVVLKCLHNKSTGHGLSTGPGYQSNC